MPKENNVSGRRIDDHKSFCGSPGKNYPLPEGNKTKRFESAEGSGHVGTDYDDTSERVREVQMKGDKEIMKQKMPQGYRY